MRRLAAFLIALVFSFILLESGLRIYGLAKTKISDHSSDKMRFDLYVVGESTTAGYPYCLNSRISFPEIAVKMFEGKIGNRPIRVHMLAVPGESIYPQAFKLDQALRGRDRSTPGAVFIYSGQNEGYLSSGRPTPFFQKVRMRLCARSTAFSTLLYYADKESLIPRVRTLGTYEFYLRHVIETSLENGLTPVISTVVSNNADVEPGLYWTDHLPTTEVIELIKKGESIEGHGQLQEAMDYYADLVRRYPGMKAYMTFRIGKCYEQMKNFETASRYYWQAIDANFSDSYMRAGELQNDLVRRLAREYNVPLVDAVSLFETHAEHRILGEELFMDGQHPNVKGYLLLADAFADALSQRTGAPVRKRFSTAPEVFEAFSYDRTQQILPVLIGGKWLFIMSMRHPYPKWRLAMAADHFQEVIRMDPHHFFAWLMLGFIHAAQQNGILLDEKELTWLDKKGFFHHYKHDFVFTRDEMRQIIEKLQGWNVPAYIIDNIARNYKIPAS